MKYFYSILFLMLASVSLGQTITISGKAVDRESKESLVFATIGIKGKPLGTVSNLQGEFDFHIPADFRNEIFVISMLGYQSYEAPVWSLLSDLAQTFELNKSTTVLEEIVVTDSLKGGEILRIALNRVEQNFPMVPYSHDGFYRDIKKVGGTYISLLEAAVRIYDEDYREPRNKGKLRERVRLIEVRKSLGYENKFTAYFDQTNLLEDLLLHNNIRYRQIDGSEDMFKHMVRERNTFYNGHAVFVVSNSRDYFLKVYIDQQDYSIIHLDFELPESDEIIDKRKGLVSRFGGLRKTIDFRRYDGKMYLNYMTVTSREAWHDQKTNELRFECELYQQLMINKVTPDSKDRIGATEKMRNYGLQYQDMPYNKVFWERYNVIKDTPLNQKIISDLEQIGPLEKQFENN